MPKISVIVPNYNHARFLRQRIDSILTQSLHDFELILLDDCSTDESRSILREYASDPRVRLEFNEVNSGSPFKQWNKGVRLAQGKYVWIAESDDYADAGFLARLVPALEADPKLTFAYCRSWRVKEGGLLDGFEDPLVEDSELPRWLADFCSEGAEECRLYFVRTNIVPNASGVVFQKAAYEKVGGADESLRLCGDWKLWAAMSLCGSIAYVSEPMNYHRFHTASVRTKSHYSALDIAEVLQVVRWLTGKVTPPDSIREILCNKYAGLWVPALMSLHVGLKRKAAILRDVRAIDPHPVRRVLHPASVAIRMKFRRHWRGLRSMIGTEKYARR